MDVLENIDEALETIKRNRRTIICSPKWAPAIRQRIYDEGLSGFVEVNESPLVDEDTAFVFDPNVLGKTGVADG